MQHHQSLEWNLIYTPMTCGRKLVVIITEPKALRMAVKLRESQRRVTRLREGVEEKIPKAWSVP